MAARVRYFFMVFSNVEVEVDGRCSYENDLSFFEGKGCAVFLIYKRMFAQMIKKGK
jgi:hypothetical protein